MKAKETGKKFTKEHKRILEKNRVYYTNLKSSGTLTKCSSVIVDELKTVYQEAVSDRRVNTWCPSCIIELIEMLYAAYDEFLKHERKTKSGAGQKPTGE